MFCNPSLSGLTFPNGTVLHPAGKGFVLQTVPGWSGEAAEGVLVPSKDALLSAGLRTDVLVPSQDALLSAGHRTDVLQTVIFLDAPRFVENISLSSCFSWREAASLRPFLTPGHPPKVFASPFLSQLCPGGAPILQLDHLWEAVLKVDSLGRTETFLQQN